MKKALFVLVIISFFTACKEKTKKTKTQNTDQFEEVKVEEAEPDFFTLTLNAIVEKNDKFTLFYFEENQTNISKDNSISITVDGSDSSQSLVFKLNEDVLPTKLILQFGNDEKSQKMIIEEALITYKTGKIEIPKELFYQFFSTNDFINYNTTNFTATAVEKNGNFNPLFTSRRVLENKIDFL